MIILKTEKLKKFQDNSAKKYKMLIPFLPVLEFNVTSSAVEMFCLAFDCAQADKKPSLDILFTCKVA